MQPWKDFSKISTWFFFRTQKFRFQNFKKPLIFKARRAFSSAGYLFLLCACQLHKNEEKGRSDGVGSARQVRGTSWNKITDNLSVFGLNSRKIYHCKCTEIETEPVCSTSQSHSLETAPAGYPGGRCKVFNHHYNNIPTIKLVLIRNPKSYSRSHSH